MYLKYFFFQFLIIITFKISAQHFYLGPELMLNAPVVSLNDPANLTTLRDRYNRIEGAYGARAGFILKNKLILETGLYNLSANSTISFISSKRAPFTSLSYWSYTIPVRLKRQLHIGRALELTPYAGLRFIYLRSNIAYIRSDEILVFNADGESTPVYYETELEIFRSPGLAMELGADLSMRIFRGFHLYVYIAYAQGITRLKEQKINYQIDDMRYAANAITRGTMPTFGFGGTYRFDLSKDQ